MDNYRKGLLTELEIDRQLSHTPGKKIVLHDTNIEIHGKKAQIDNILLHQTGIYVIECKNYSGWIFGTQTDKEWTQLLAKGQKYKFYNPIKQNETHIKRLQTKLNQLERKFFANVICFSNKSTLKKVPQSTHDTIIATEQTIYRDIGVNMFERTIYFGEKELQWIQQAIEL